MAHRWLDVKPSVLHRLSKGKVPDQPSVYHICKNATLHLLICIVHVVVNRIETLLVWACVASSGAAKSGRGLSRRVRHSIGVVAAALKRVLETEPVANLVHRDATQVVLVGVGRAVDDVVVHGAAIQEPSVGARDNVVNGVVAVPRGTGCLEVLDVVQVQVLVGTLAELLLHVEPVEVGGPGRVDGVIDIGEDELEVGIVEVYPKNLYLVYYFVPLLPLQSAFTVGSNLRL